MTSLPPLDFRVNMAASMASQAAARGLRAAATSKHLFLDKIKVPFAIISLRMNVLCPAIGFLWRVHVAVAPGSRLCNDVASGLACLWREFGPKLNGVTNAYTGAAVSFNSCRTDKEICCWWVFEGVTLRCTSVTLVIAEHNDFGTLTFTVRRCLRVSACIQSVRLACNVTRRGFFFIELKMLEVFCVKTEIARLLAGHTWNRWGYACTLPGGRHVSSKFLTASTFPDKTAVKRLTFALWSPPPSVCSVSRETLHKMRVVSFVFTCTVWK